ncbi:hypothetical protein BGX28_009516 [Mortierella sp. GBA30]|nr:hypothetical protein BGX28_009516 [Mortierella sp. GBA30]
MASVVETDILEQEPPTRLESMHTAAEMESDAPIYELSADHPGYSLPITNITYHVDPTEKQRAQCKSTARKAFQRIMDSYEDYERMTDVFQIEHERREQHERELKEERQRLRKLQKSKKKKQAFAPASTASSSSTTPSKAATPVAFCTAVPIFPPTPCSVAAQQDGARKKRKQYIPVHPSVVNRIPGITLRIQPDTNQSQQLLQVEILKNVDDYQGDQQLEGSAGSDHSDIDLDGSLVPDTAHDDGNMEDSRHSQSRLQAKQDLDKVQKSIESGWPGYSYFPLSHFRPVKLEHAYYRQQQQYPQDEKDADMHDDALAPNHRHSHHGKHKRHQSSDSTDRRKSSSHHQEGSPSADASSTWPQDVAIPISDLPLSWNNFSTRDCRVNRVIGKQDRDFGLLEEVVQEAVARQHAAHLESEDESESESQEPSEGQFRNSEKSHRPSRALEREDSTTGDALSRKTTRSASKRPAVAAFAPTAPTATGTRATRSRTHPHEHDGDVVELVEGYDDIEQVLKAKRQKKRLERMRAASEATSVTSAAADDEERDSDDGDAYAREDGEEGRTSIRFKKPPALTLSSGRVKADVVTSPPSPPNSRQVTPAKGESTAGSRRPSVSSHARTTKSHSRTTSISGNEIASTPPATPTRATHGHPQDHRNGAEFTSKSPASGRTRASGRSLSNVIPKDAGTNFFESAAYMIEAKRRESLAKKRAAAAAATVTTKDTNNASTSTSASLDPRELERELEHLTSQVRPAQLSGPMESRAVDSNLPKSSKTLPGRVLRRVVMDHDREGRSVDVEPLFDPDCTSCRLELTEKDKESWKKARQNGEIQLNPRTWSKTASLCTECRTQYQSHHLRCTQCFFVPVAGRAAAPKPGGTCIRCRAGTWLKEGA